MASSSSCVRLAAIHPYQHQTFRKPKQMLVSRTYVHADLTSSLTRASCSFPKTLLITCQKNKLQCLSPKTLQHPNFSISSVSTSSKSTICMATSSYEYTSSPDSSENNPKIPTTEICILVFVYIIPFLNRLNLLSKFPVLKYVTSPIMPLLRFYQSILTLGLVGFLSLFIAFVRYRNATKFKYSLVMDSVVVMASLVRPFVVNSVPLGGGALAFKFQLLNVLELLGFQTCVHSCLEYLGAVQWVGEEEKVDVISDPSIGALANIMEVVIKTNENEGRQQGKSLVLKILRENKSLISDINSSETCTKNILSSCQSCSNSLLDLYKKAYYDFVIYDRVDKDVDKQISLEVDNLLWLLDIMVDRQAAEKFALMWANQKELANFHMKFQKEIRAPSHHLFSFITTRLLAGIGKGEILLTKDIGQLLFQTWFQPLVDDYPCLRKAKSFDPKEVEENIETAILELAPEDQQSVLMAWYECFLKNSNNCPDLRKAFQGWCNRTFR